MPPPGSLKGKNKTKNPPHPCTHLHHTHPKGSRSQANLRTRTWLLLYWFLYSLYLRRHSTLKKRQWFCIYVRFTAGLKSWHHTFTMPWYHNKHRVVLVKNKYGQQSWEMLRSYRSKIQEAWFYSAGNWTGHPQYLSKGIRNSLAPEQ